MAVFRPVANRSASDAVAAAGLSFSPLMDPWAQVTHQELELYPLPGDHYSMLAEPHVAELASVLHRLLGAPSDGSPPRKAANVP